VYEFLCVRENLRERERVDMKKGENGLRLKSHTAKIKIVSIQDASKRAE